MAVSKFLCVALAALIAVCSAKERQFSNDKLVGFYGRFFELVKGDSPAQQCSQILSHVKQGTVDTKAGKVIIFGETTYHNGNKCVGEMIMEDTPDVNPVADIGRSNEIFANFQASDGFWVGSTKKSCGRWDFPDPTAVFMVYDADTALTGPYGVRLPKNERFIIFTNEEYTCVYRDVQKPTKAPTPPPVAGSTGGDNETFSSEESFQDDKTIGVPVTVLPGAPDSDELEPSPSDEEDDGSVCFPADAVVELADGSFKTMDKVTVGDRVRVGANKFSDVYMFTHKLSGVSYDFVQISTASDSIKLTKGHYLYINGALAAAKTAKIGDSIQLASGEIASVTSVSFVKGTGLFNPQTVDGDIVVNNVLASTYTTTVEPSVAHNLLFPLRALYKAAGFATTLFDAGADGMAKFVPSGAAVY